MMNNLLPILMISSFAVLFAERSGIMQNIRWRLKVSGLWFKEIAGRRMERRLKPFDCSMCLAFWMALFIPHHSIIESVGYGAIAAMVAVMIEKATR